MIQHIYYDLVSADFIKLPPFQSRIRFSVFFGGINIKNGGWGKLSHLPNVHFVYLFCHPIIKHISWNHKKNLGFVKPRFMAVVLKK